MPTWNTALWRSTVSTSLRPSAIVSVGFSENTSLPASRAMQRDRHVPVVGRGDDHGVDVLAGDQVAEIGDLLAARGRVLLVDRFPCPPAAAGHDVADGDRPGVVLDEEGLQVMSITFAAQSDEAQRDPFRGGRIAEQPRGQDQRRGRRADDARDAADRPAAGDCGWGLSLGKGSSSMWA